MLFTMVPFIVAKDKNFDMKSVVDQKRFFSVPLGDGQTVVSIVHFLRDRSKGVLNLYRVANTTSSIKYDAAIY